MFQSLEPRAQHALGTICKESISSPVVPHDAGYLNFVTKVVEPLEENAKKVVTMVDEECRDLLGQALMHVFRHLLCPTLISTSRL
ncbi:hypothetical protein D1007_09578 [Hordeum vulgare]|nr:hypothetical protein D1007_09578 [Hordeum vulgare]